MCRLGKMVYFNRFICGSGLRRLREELRRKPGKVRRDMSRMLENMCFWLYTVYVNKIGGVTIRKVRSESSGKISGKRRGEREGRSL